MTTSSNNNLKWWQQQQLERQGCRAVNWQKLRISVEQDLTLLQNVKFSGDVEIGKNVSICNAEIDNCTIEDDVVIENVIGGIHNATVREGAEIINVARIEFEPEAPCGVGLQVDVLDESGSRPVTIYPGLSSQMAMLQARKPRWRENVLRPILMQHLEQLPVCHEIGVRARVRDCGPIKNVMVGREVTIENARRLQNGSIINNAAAGRALAYVGSGVDAAGFIFEDAVVDSGVTVRNCYVGQGASLDKGFTAHDSLFFANSACENGEACAFFAGPYTVSMHKASLLIGCQASFMNAGSATNQSNHMYKLGPVHWGILERGVKTSSNSYLMLGANIGAFSLLMGSHKTHPDSTTFPFSYLFGDERGATVVVPGQMLRSCGLMRDEKKWPTRDKRLKRKLPLHDRIHFQVLSPYTVERMLNALDVIDNLLAREADDDRYVRWRGMKFSRASLERAKILYTCAIYKYLYVVSPDFAFETESVEKDNKESAQTYTSTSVSRWQVARDKKDANQTEPQPRNEWIDLAGQIMPRENLKKILEAQSIEEMERHLSMAYNNFENYQRDWITATFDKKWRKHPEVIKEYADKFDAEVEADRADYMAQLAMENESQRL